MVLWAVLIFLAASVVLVKSASYAVRSVSKIASGMSFTPFFTAFVFAGFISITPELFIGINSALIGLPGVGIGTIIGSNIADMTLLIGIVALIGRKLPVDKKTISNNFYFVAITALPIVLMTDGQLTRDDGLILVFAFVLYLYSIIKSQRVFSRGRNTRKKNSMKSFAVFLASMAALFASAHFMVEAGISIAEDLEIQPILIALLVIALGTTLPEFTLSLRAVMARHKEIALGDLLGNVAIDSTLTIGVVAMISPLTSNFSLLISGALFMILAALVVTTLLNAGRSITWQDSFLLLFIYAMFIAMELIVKGAVPA